MKRWKSDTEFISNIGERMNGENSRLPIHRRPASLLIRVREMDCALTDIQAEIQMLRREKTISEWYGENWPVGNRATVFVTLHHFVEGAGSRPVLLESTRLEDLQVRGEWKRSREPRRFS